MKVCSALRNSCCLTHWVSNHDNCIVFLKFIYQISIFIQIWIILIIVIPFELFVKQWSFYEIVIFLRKWQEMDGVPFEKIKFIDFARNWTKSDRSEQIQTWLYALPGLIHIMQVFPFNQISRNDVYIFFIWAYDAAWVPMVVDGRQLILPFFGFQVQTGNFSFISNNPQFQQSFVICNPWILSFSNHRSRQNLMSLICQMKNRVCHIINISHI